MGKYEKRRVFRAFRKAEFPFMLSARLARVENLWNLSNVLGDEFRHKVVTDCECCGPSRVEIWAVKKPTKIFSVNAFTLRP
jgi:hypothetical protein